MAVVWLKELLHAAAAQEGNDSHLTQDDVFLEEEAVNMKLYLEGIIPDHKIPCYLLAQNEVLCYAVMWGFFRNI